MSEYPAELGAWWTGFPEATGPPGPCRPRPLPVAVRPCRMEQEGLGQEGVYARADAYPGQARARQARSSGGVAASVDSRDP